MGTNRVSFLAAGLVIGIALGLLLAYKERKETRETVALAIESGIERMREPEGN